MSVTNSRAGRLALACSSAAALMYGGVALAICQAPDGTPATAGKFQTQCESVVAIPDAATNTTGGIRSFDISWVDPKRGLYFLGDRSNAGIDIVSTQGTPHFVGRAGGFVGILPKTGAVNNNISGPDGVVSRGKVLYGGDGDSTLKIFDISNPAAPVLLSTTSTGGTTRVDEMALDAAGTLLLAANNAEDPPYASLIDVSNPKAPKIVLKIEASTAFIMQGDGLSMEQPTFESKTKRFYVSVPQIRGNPSGCDLAGKTAPFCEGGLAVIDPAHPTATIGPYDATSNTGMIPLHDCGPNGSTVGPHANILLGCTPQNVPTNTSTLVINAKTHNFANIGNITGSDEVWYNAGDKRYYTGSSRACGLAGGCPNGGAALGVIDGVTNLLIEKIPQSSNSHSVAADSGTNRIFVPQVGAAATVGTGGDTTAVGQNLCGGPKGCVVVFRHRVEDDDHEGGDGEHGGDGGHDE